MDILDCEQPLTFTATIAGAPTDPDPANNTAELQLEIEPVPVLPMVALVLLAVALSAVTLHRLRRGPRTEQ